MERWWHKLVIEGERQKPLSVKRADIFRSITIIFLIVISGAVLFANLSIKTYSIEDNAEHVLTAICFTGIHIWYLYIVLNILILDCPIEKNYWQRFIFPFFLLLAYLFYALQVWAHTTLNISIGYMEPIFKIISLSLFAILYILWMLRDFLEYRMTKGFMSLMWITGEIVSLILLGVGISREFLSNNDLMASRLYPFIDDLTSQNGPIFICLFIYILCKFISKFSQEKETYRDLYDNYLRYNKINVPPLINLNLSNYNELNILDFGCGNGQRLVQNLSWIDGIDKSKITVTGFDKRNCFDSKFTDNLDDKDIKNYFTSKIEHLDPKNFDIIILSHVLYEHSVACMVLNFLKQCKSNTIILFRGASPNSFFVSTSFAGANSISFFAWKRNRSHLWYSIWLDWIKNDAELIRKEQNTEKADYIVEQTYDITKKNSIECASLLLKKLYKGGLANRAEDYFVALKTYANITNIPNNDLIYVYIKQ